MRTRILFAAIILAVAGATAAAAALNSGDDATGSDVEEPAPGDVAGMCLPEVPDCVDTVVEDEFDVEAARQLAFSLIGTAEADLPADVRVERRGDEHMMLTEDYVLGRMTVQLDDDGTGTFRVTVLIVELPDGPETIMS